MRNVYAVFVGKTKMKRPVVRSIPISGDGVKICISGIGCEEVG
jgi:hypothetical protein